VPRNPRFKDVLPLVITNAGPLETRAILGLLARLAIPSLLLAAICWFALEFLFQAGAPLPEWQKIIGMLLVIAVAAAAFFGSAFLFRVTEVRDIVDLVRQRFDRTTL